MAPNGLLWAQDSITAPLILPVAAYKRDQYQHHRTQRFSKCRLHTHAQGMGRRRWRGHFHIRKWRWRRVCFDHANPGITDDLLPFGWRWRAEKEGAAYRNPAVPAGPRKQATTEVMAGSPAAHLVIRVVAAAAQRPFGLVVSVAPLSSRQEVAEGVPQGLAIQGPELPETRGELVHKEEQQRAATAHRAVTRQVVAAAAVAAIPPAAREE